MNSVLLDDHLLRDVLVGDPPPAVARILRTRRPATTNHYYYRLCRSAVAATGGALTGTWPVERRRALASQLLTLPAEVEVIEMKTLAFRMAELAAAHRLSTLGAEAVAAAELRQCALYVWAGDDGPGIRAAMRTVRRDYRAVHR